MDTETIIDDPELGNRRGEDDWEWVDAEPFRALVRHLCDASQLPVHHLACKLGISVPLCARLLVEPRRTTVGIRGDRPLHRIPLDVAEQLLRTDAVGLCAELESTLSAHRARATIRNLLAAGHRLTTLHRVTGLPLEMLEQLATGAASCSGRVDAALQAAELWAETHPIPHAPSELAA